MYSRKFSVTAIAAIVIATGSSFAQSTTGALVGVVRDATGAVVPKASVTATNTGTGVVYTGVSTGSGEYRIANLPNGIYDVSTSVPGFAPNVKRGVGIEANNVQTEDFALGSAAQSTLVEVSSEAAVSIDTTTAQITSVFSAKETQDLPTATQVGLGVYNLSLLAPGVSSTGGLGAGRGPSVSGQRPRDNNFEIDGIDNNNKSVTGPLINVPNDAIGQFTSLQNVYSAQYGHSTGGQFNELITTGTNSIHGRVYEYLQNRNLNAVSSVQANINRASGTAANFQPRFDFNRYGGQVGGPLIKDRLFAFSNYERQELGQSANGGYCSPTAAGYAALNAQTFGTPGAVNTNNLATYEKFSLPAAAQAPGADTFCSNGNTISVTNLAGATTVIPVGDVGFQLPQYQNLTFSTSSLDYTISPKDSLHGRYAYSRQDGTDTSASFTAFYIASPVRYHLVNLDEIHTFTPNLTNDFRVGYTRYFNQTPVPNITFPGLNTFPNINVEDVGFVDLGPDPNAPQATITNLYQAVETLTWQKGRHTITAGVEGRKYIAPELFVQRVRGDYDYATLSSYLNDLAPTGTAFGIPGGSSRNATPPGVSPTFYGDQTAIYAFGNDDYRVTPQLTLNLGLRYEFTSVPASSKLQSLNTAASVPGLISFNQPNPQKKNFAPRIGVAYAPNASTSIRAAFGINYDVIYDNIGTTTAPPQFQITENIAGTPNQTSFLATGGLPANQTFATLAAQRAATTAYVPDQKVPYSEQWTLGVQHVFHNDYTAEVRYVGTRGVHLDVQEQLNIQSPVNATTQLPTAFNGGSVVFNGSQTLAAIRASNANGAPFYRVPAYYAAGLTSTITSDLPIGGSNYNGLQTQLTRRFSKGLLINAAYTYSRAMDDSTADFNTTALNPRRPQDAQNLKAEYSVSDLDRRHRLTLVGVYDLQIFHNRGLLYNILHVEIDPSYTFQSPQLVTVQSAIDSNLNNDGAGDRVFINPNGVRGTGSAVVPLVNPSIACPAGSPYGGVRNGTGGVAMNCTANTIGYTEGTITAATSTSAAVFHPSNAYFVQGGSGTDPNSPRNNLATGRTNNFDLAIFKRVSYHDRYKLEFGAQALNVLNHAQYLPGSPSTADQFTSTSTLNANFARVASPNFNNKFLAFSNNPRNLQLSGKFIF